MFPGCPQLRYAIKGQWSTIYAITLVTGTRKKQRRYQTRCQEMGFSIREYPILSDWAEASAETRVSAPRRRRVFEHRSVAGYKPGTQRKTRELPPQTASVVNRVHSTPLSVESSSRKPPANITMGHASTLKVREIIYQGNSPVR